MAVRSSDVEDTPEARERWRAGVGNLVSYKYLGTYSETLGRHAAEGWMTIRRDLRGPVGLLVAPLGVALLDTAGINVDPIAIVSPTRIDLHVFEPAVGVERVHLDGRVIREARSQMFTEARITDASDPTRLLAIGSTHWAVAEPNPVYSYVDPRPGVADDPELPPLYEAYGARLRDDGSFEIPTLVPELGRNGLHQGPIQVVSEAAAMSAAEAAMGTDRFWVEHQGISIVQRGMTAPFVTHAEVLHSTPDLVHVRVELRDEGAGGRVFAVGLYRFAFE